MSVHELITYHLLTLMCSVPLRAEDEGTIIATITVSNESNSILIHKVIVQTVLANDIGDKFSSLHGQKGTVGEWLKTWELPFSAKDGCTADFYQSIIGLTSRLTDGHMIDGQYTTYGVEAGEIVPATTFDNLTREQQRKYVEDRVLHYGGTLCQNEGFINGETGQLMRPLCVFYIPMLKLRHMAQDKYHTRGKGPRQVLNRQATDGKSRQGALKTGPMERECMLSFGASATASDRMDKLSDPFITAYCKNCERPTTFEESHSYKYCNLCCTGEYVEPVRTTHTTTLSLDELYAMCITTTAKTVNENIPITCKSAQWDPNERKQHAEQQHASMYKLYTMPTLELSEYRKYGAEDIPTLRTFMQTQPSLNRKSKYTNSLTKDSSIFIQMAEDKELKENTDDIAMTSGKNSKSKATTADGEQVKKKSTRGRKRKDPTTTGTTGKKQKKNNDSDDKAIESRTAKMSAFLSKLVPVKRAHKYNSM